MKKLAISIWQHKWTLLFYAVMAAVFLINTLHTSYPDEFDNISGGWFILHGKLIYTGWFTHHGPFPYYLAALLEIFSGDSFVRFRLMYAVAMLAYFIGISYLLKGRVSELSQKLFLVFTAVFGIAATYYWAHMLLADNVAALTFVPVFIVIIDKLFTKKPFTLNDILFLSILMACGFYASLAYIYVLAFFAVVILGNYYWTEKKKLHGVLAWLKPLVMFAIPHLVFGLYLVLTGSVSAYYHDAWVFNEKYYIFNYPRPEGAGINPVRYSIMIVHNFMISFQTVLIGVKYFDFGSPMNITLALGDAAVFIYLLMKRKFFLAGFVLLTLALTTPRSDLSKSQETDYQAAMYILFSYWNILWVLRQSAQSLKEEASAALKVVSGFLLLLVGVYSIFAGLYLFNGFFTKAYLKYMGTSPLIYDRPSAAPVINTVIGPNDYMWIGPFAFEDLFYAHGKFPSMYQILIPGMAHDPQIRARVLADFEKNPPKVMIFDRHFVVLGNDVGQYGSFLIDFFDKNYVTPLAYHDGNTVYRSVAPIEVGKLDLETQLYVRNDVVQEVLPKLVDAGYLKRVTVK